METGAVELYGPFSGSWFLKLKLLLTAVVLLVTVRAASAVARACYYSAILLYL
jgi:hypothetical protein